MTLREFKRLAPLRQARDLFARQELYAAILRLNPNHPNPLDVVNMVIEGKPVERSRIS